MRGVLVPLLVLLLALALQGILMASLFLHGTSSSGESLRLVTSRTSLLGVHVTVTGAEKSGSLLLVKLRIQTPNPCYHVSRADVVRTSSGARIIIEVKTPAKNTFCIQVVPMPVYYTATISIDKTPFQVDLSLIVGGKEKTVELLVVS